MGATVRFNSWTDNDDSLHFVSTLKSYSSTDDSIELDVYSNDDDDADTKYVFIRRQEEMYVLK